MVACSESYFEEEKNVDGLTMLRLCYSVDVFMRLYYVLSRGSLKLCIREKLHLIRDVLILQNI